MAYPRPTLTELVDRVKVDLESRVIGGETSLRRSFLSTLSRVMAGTSHMLHGHIDWVSKQVMPDSADTDYLDRWTAIWGLSRTPATYAIGAINFTGTNGAVIPAGTILTRADDVEFSVDSDVTIVAGVATGAVTCKSPGATGNTDAAVSFSFQAALAEVDPSAIVATSGLAGGEDAESDDALRLRLLNRIQSPPHGGKLEDYVVWALEVAGVTRAWAYGNDPLPGQVRLTFVRDDDPGSIIPDSTEVAEVQAYIDGLRPVTAELTVFQPVSLAVNFTIGLTTDTAAIRAAVIASLTDLFRREGKPGGTIFISRIREAISTADGEIDHVLTAPVANVVQAGNEVATLGTVTFT